MISPKCHRFAKCVKNVGIFPRGPEFFRGGPEFFPGAGNIFRRGQKYFSRGTKFHEFSEKLIGISKSRNLCFSCTPTSTLDEQKCTLFRRRLSVLGKVYFLWKSILISNRENGFPESDIFVETVETFKTFETC